MTANVQELPNRTPPYYSLRHTTVDRTLAATSFRPVEAGWPERPQGAKPEACCSSEGRRTMTCVGTPTRLWKQGLDNVKVLDHKTTDMIKMPRERPMICSSLQGQSVAFGAAYVSLCL